MTSLTLCVCACAPLLLGVRGIDEGFDLFFSSNLDEMTDVPIQFENPLPTWLKGTLVSSHYFYYISENCVYMSPILRIVFMHS